MLSLLLVPGAGIEPARIAPLVFETSASTDSAIRACCIWEAAPHQDAGCIQEEPGVFLRRSLAEMLKAVDLLVLRVQRYCKLH